MRYVLAAIAGIWMADGLALLVAPRQVIARVREVLTLTPRILRWEAVAASLGILLIIGSRDLHYRLLWTIAGLTMLAKGVFLAMGPFQWRHQVVEWCLRREEVDYRFWGLGLCTLAILLLHALGWVGAQ
ncbi:MAG TPA: hypothetical protein VJ692_00370 [Nitrospiraceae bacterium]|nr:hypothetical protein [Nitrospiraceae bacterium]